MHDCINVDIGALAPVNLNFPIAYNSLFFEVLIKM